MKKEELKTQLEALNINALKGVRFMEDKKDIIVLEYEKFINTEDDLEVFAYANEDKEEVELLAFLGET